MEGKKVFKFLKLKDMKKNTKKIAVQVSKLIPNFFY